MYCEDCSQKQFLKCGEIPQDVSRPCDLIKLFENISVEQRKKIKVIIMRIDKETNEWYAFICKTDIAVDVGADCCLKGMSIADVLDTLVKFDISTEIRYDYFR